MEKLRILLLLLLGCSTGVLSAQVKSFNHGGYTRSYTLHLPAGYTGSQPVPLVLNLHGYGSNMSQQQLYTGFDYISDTAGFIVVYPDGVSNAWNVGFTGNYNGGVDDVGFIKALVDTLHQTYNIDVSRIYSTGMSNGGFMSYRLACELPGTFAAIASVTGSMTPVMQSYCPYQRDFPIMEVHGTNDQTVPYSGNFLMTHIDSVISYWVIRNNSQFTPAVYNFPDIVTSDSSTVVRYTFDQPGSDKEVVLYKVVNGGHTWPGAPDVPNLGVTNKDIKASGEIWDFFRRHVNPAPTTSMVESSSNQEPPIYPNPANMYFHIRGFEGHVVHAISLTGQLIERIPVKDGICQPEQLSQGVYLIRSPEGKNLGKLMWSGRVN